MRAVTNVVGKYAKDHNICLNHNWSILAATAAGVAVFLIGRRGRRQNVLMAAFGAVSTATATYAALNCASQKAIGEVVEEAKQETKEVLAKDSKSNGHTSKPALTGQGN
ncbi:MAG: hypothetical protein KF812_05610 [Fimbriimonadaceae bacterium]|nr:hypothetical protein [Fimbriimonadaceae bacterium]